MASLVILGASGFVGRAIIGQKKNTPIKAVARRKPSDRDLHADNITWFAADLSASHSLDTVLEPEDIVINTAYLKTGNDEDNLRLISNIIESCHRQGVKRLVHCSTAMVAGTTKSVCIDETVPCIPYTPYEQNKYAIEELLLNASGTLEVVIVRPTAIVGAGGKNLVKLAESLLRGNPLINYARASLFGKRNMHLVSVHHVASAILHLAEHDDCKNGSIYYISADNDPKNNFLSVEKFLSEALGLKPRKIPVLPVPSLFLSFLLKLKGRSESSLARIYDSKKLVATDFIAIDTVYDAVNEFGKSVLSDSDNAGK
ncbi:MAG: NAD(P)-dependent oxidoreductase [Legionella sp.]|nr:NAD(P)-dependent oxidoreductase [Legionella sp.]